MSPRSSGWSSLVLVASLTAQKHLFDPVTSVAVGPMPGEPVLADLNGDGHLDVVVACGTCCGSKPQADSGHVMVLLGDGKGGLAPAQGMPVKVGDSVRKVAVGDLNGDGALDVVAAQHESYELVILRGDGKGGLAIDGKVATRTGARAHTHDVTLADLDGDGRLDVLASNANDGDVSVLLGNGFGRFAPLAASPVRLGRHPYDAVLAHDVDGDGLVDLIAPDLHSGVVAVSRQSPAGQFAPAAGTPLRAGPRPGYVALVDLDGDGDRDLVATHDDDPIVAIWRNDSGRFAVWPGAPLRLTAPVWGITSGDFDQDGHMDLAFASPQAGVISVTGAGNARLGLAGWPVELGGNTNYLAAGDLDGDGRLELVVTGYASGLVHVLRLGSPNLPRRALGEDTIDTVAVRLDSDGLTAGARRDEWLWAIAAGQADALIARATPPAGSRDAAAWLALARAHMGRLEACVGGELPVTAHAADVAFAHALDCAPQHFDARYERAMALASWPPRAGKTAAAVAEFEALLAAHGSSDDARLEIARRKLAELRKR